MCKSRIIEKNLEACLNFRKAIETLDEFVL